MIPVEQTKLSRDGGNCFAACVASIFEVPLEDIPNFCHEDGWPVNLQNWLKDNYGLCALEMDKNRGDRLWFDMTEGEPLPVYTIVSGPSPRLDDCLHCVVYWGYDMVHDPHPDGNGVEDEVLVMYFVSQMIGDVINKERG